MEPSVKLEVSLNKGEETGRQTEKTSPFCGKENEPKLE